MIRNAKPQHQAVFLSGFMCSYGEKVLKLSDYAKGFESSFPIHPKISLLKLFDNQASTESRIPYQDVVREWAISYLTAPHPNLGREGAVCPFTAASISKEMFWVGCVNRSDLKAEEIKRAVADVVAEFRQLPPAQGPDAILKTILVLFPEITDYSVIDEAQRCLKEESVALGLMIGQFYPGCEEPGIRNPSFRPLRSPVPLLAIRHMVGSDLPFLTARVEWVEQYLDRFAPSIPSHVRNMIAAKFDTDRL